MNVATIRLRARPSTNQSSDAKNLTAIQRINGQHIENEQAEVHEPTAAAGREHWASRRPSPSTGSASRAPSELESARHLPTGRRRCSTVWRPAAAADQHMPLRREATARCGSRSPHLAAGQRVAELVKHHNQKQRKVLQKVPGERRIGPRPAIDFIRRHQKPGPMQKQVDPGEAEQTH